MSNYKTLIISFVLSLCLSFIHAAIVKRDTISDIKDSLGDALGISEDKSLMEELEDLDIDRTKYCIQDSVCVKYIEYCDKSVYKLYGTCEYGTEFYILIGVVIAILLFVPSIIGFICCCLKRCC